MSTSLVSLASLVQAFNPVTPQLRVAAIIVRQNQILLVEHRKRGQRYWVLPGGRLEGHETLEAALRRELKEELGLDARVGPLAIVCESLAPDRHVVNLIFQAEIGEGAAPVLDPRDPVLAGLAVVVGGPAPPAGFPPTHCPSRPGRHRRALCRPRPRARGYLEARVPLSSSPASRQRRKVNILRTSQLGRGSETGGRLPGSPTSATVLEMRLDDLGERRPDIGQR